MGIEGENLVKELGGVLELVMAGDLRWNGLETNCVINDNTAYQTTIRECFAPVRIRIQASVKMTSCELTSTGCSSTPTGPSHTWTASALVTLNPEETGWSSSTKGTC